MKRFAATLLAFIIGFSPVASLRTATALGANLIPNPSAETAANAVPTNWTKDFWGTNTRTFTLDKTTAQDGSNSLYVQLKTRTSGDAKWAHKEVSVTPSTSYTFYDYYKSNIASQVIVQTLGTNGAYTYQTLKSPAAASAWTKNEISFTTTATAKAVTVFHLIQKVGYLYTDNYFLGLTNGTAPSVPAVSITAPAANTTLSGTTTVSASATDSAGIAGVQFKLDGANLGSEDTTAPYSASWNTLSAANGAHTLTAVARSTSGTTATATAVPVTVTNIPAATVSISTPAANSTVSGTQAIAATATNAVGVQFKLDGTNLGNEVTTAPFTINWDTTTAAYGTHTLTAVARNSANVATTSASVTVQVNNVPASTVSISAPTANATVSGTIQIDAATTNTTGVQFYVDDSAYNAEDTSAPFSTTLDTTKLTNGVHNVRAVARNSVNQLVSSTTVQVTVQNIVTPPSITNLIANPSLETADPAASSKPLSWLNGGWGTNTASYTYDTTGRTGNRSVTTKITAFTSGDAKWYFAPVDITANTTYDYSHYYKSTVTTDVLAQFTDATGNNTYQYLATVAPSASWQLFGVQIKAPASAKKMTILHVLYGVGSLSLDDASLSVFTPAPTDTAVIKNGSFETASSNPNLPVGWETGSWGTNTPFFEYLNEAYSGARSVKLTMTNYVDGDAKWFFTPVSSLASGKMYRFSTHYKTNTIPKAVAQFERTDGSIIYFGMPNPQPNGTSDWQYYSDTFTVPENTKTVTVFFLLNGNGYVQMDDESIVDYTPTGFNRPLLSLTFDDGFEDNNQTVLPMTAAYGFKTTQCYDTQFVQENSTNPQLVLDFKNAGHEICSHTMTHPFLTSLNSAQLTTELKDSQSYLANLIGQPVPDFASPYGDYNEAVNNEIKKYYRSHRTVDEGFNSKDNFDIYRIRVQNILSTTTATQVASWIAQAKATNTWLVLVYHKVSNTDVGQFDSYTSDFAAQLKAISDSGITVKTYSDALDEVTAQL